MASTAMRVYDVLARIAVWESDARELRGRGCYPRARTYYNLAAGAAAAGEVLAPRAAAKWAELFEDMSAAGAGNEACATACAFCVARPPVAIACADLDPYPRPWPLAELPGDDGTRIVEAIAAMPGDPELPPMYYGPRAEGPGAAARFLGTLEDGGEAGR